MSLAYGYGVLDDTTSGVLDDTKSGVGPAHEDQKADTTPAWAKNLSRDVSAQGDAAVTKVIPREEENLAGDDSDLEKAAKKIGDTIEKVGWFVLIGLGLYLAIKVVD